jgi:hypothetical protein
MEKEKRNDGEMDNIRNKEDNKSIRRWRRKIKRNRKNSTKKD